MRRLLLLLLLLVTGCGGASAAIVAPPGVPAGVACGTVRIAVNPWAGYAANVAVVSYLLRTELGCEVRTTDLTEEASWAGIAAGDIDLILENWGHDDLRRRYIDQEKVAVSMGVTGNRGVIGWYVPPWMKAEYPDIDNWRALNRHAPLFRTDRSGERGQFLAGDPSFVTNDAALITNLDLDYTVVHAGSEDRLIRAFRQAEADRTPLIGYFYEPQWLLAEVDLVHVPLPRHRPGCDATPAEVACDYPAYHLDKIGRLGFLRSGSPAVELAENFRWSNADQNAVARDMTVNKLSPDDAARRWLAANPQTWRPWLR
ncbi:ABC transporter substrate-binding protein [Actinoplanes sp. NBC_00393]|uniref:ABC transporter substrate-binding protein n=1 Tax=Actinoplanes sp. NBC_00393 TaxID=2975953 RepID=UPI002E24BF96